MKARLPDHRWRLATGVIGLLIGALGLFVCGVSVIAAVKLAATEATAATLLLISATSGPEWLPQEDDYEPQTISRDSTYFLRIGRFWLLSFSLVAGAILGGWKLNTPDTMVVQRICNDIAAANPSSTKEAEQRRTTCLIAAGKLD